MDTAQRARWMQSRIKHGGYLGGKELPEHYTWRSMVDRCTRQTTVGYEYYGGRGITVCKRWLKYENFLADMGVRPSKEHSLERIDTNKGYSPKNCKWATRSEQQKNKITTKIYTNGAFVGTLVECAKYIGVSKALAFYRFKHWGSFEKGIVWQIQKKRRSRIKSVKS
jgi:hypothetical protein